MKLTRRALAEKLAWIAALSKEKAPLDEAGLRALLNGIVRDVREVHKLLTQSPPSAAWGSEKPGKNVGANERLLTAHGGYRGLRSFQTAEVVYDATVIFCNRFISRRSRTHDQMVQAARSGRQNIAEGSMASATSKKTELKLTNVAKASLEELLLDYEDFLRQQNLRQWQKNDAEARAVRYRYRNFPQEWFLSDLSDLSDQSDPSDKKEVRDPYGVGTAPPEVAANTILCLINQTCFLLKRQLERLEQDFLAEGGFTERLYRTRKNSRRQG
ncbi:four helix bundle suffix domain-containing protein [Geoalkalibacter sp.]|uniref:four helix bundle suffix domain-containing protein n=1 Tax=Geoalkalibacter sp. TaxID=3041440 RepID=UPI00272ECA91|nr:four helix bundle suffix domain-containing protein [Geoalkalibacter sp.]